MLHNLIALVAAYAANEPSPIVAARQVSEALSVKQEAEAFVPLLAAFIAMYPAVHTLAADGEPAARNAVVALDVINKEF